MGEGKVIHLEEWKAKRRRQRMRRLLREWLPKGAIIALALVTVGPFLALLLAWTAPLVVVSFILNLPVFAFAAARAAKQAPRPLEPACAGV